MALLPFHVEIHHARISLKYKKMCKISNDLREIVQNDLKHNPHPKVFNEIQCLSNSH